MFLCVFFEGCMYGMVYGHGASPSLTSAKKTSSLCIVALQEGLQVLLLVPESCKFIGCLYTLHKFTIRQRVGLHLKIDPGAPKGNSSSITWVVPPPSKSHHHDYCIFSRGSQPKPSFATGILGRGDNPIYNHPFSGALTCWKNFEGMCFAVFEKSNVSPAA